MKTLSHLVITGVIAFSLIFSSAANAQDPAGLLQEELKLSREMIKLERKKIIAANMKLSPAEAKAFWPIYDQYIASIKLLNDRKFKVITDYRDAYNTGTFDNLQARDALDEIFKINRSRLNLRQAQVPKLRKVLSPTKVLRFIQVDNKLDAIIDYDLARSIPVVPGE